MPPAQVQELLQSRPTTWLRAFLHLATLAIVSPGLAPPATRHWYRLGAPRPGGAGTVAVPLTWWPHADGALFLRFQGGFVVQAAEHGSVLMLDGETTGGEVEPGWAVLRTLVDLIGAALSAAQCVDG